jgi:transcriptional regulator GlxA family with amidase domain
VLPGHDVKLVAVDAVDAVLQSRIWPDVVIIGGSLSTKEPDQAIVQWLRQVHPTTTWTTSVCTGSIYLAAAGILDEHEATTHWRGPNSWNATVPTTPSSGWWNTGK